MTSISLFDTILKPALVLLESVPFKSIESFSLPNITIDFPVAGAAASVTVEPLRVNLKEPFTMFC